MDPSTETATQALHRITSYGRDDASDPDLGWAPPVDDPRVVADLVVNDTDRLPWFYKRYPDDLPTESLPRDLPTTSAPPTHDSAEVDRWDGSEVKERLAARQDQ